MWSSSPSAMGLPSSPLNPYASSGGPSSSSPVTSPTPSYHTPSNLTLGSPSLRHRPISQPILPRYTRPNTKRSPTTTHHGRKDQNATIDIFEGGPSPVQNAMWKERFTRRVKDRERRKKARENDLDRRRSVDRSDELVDEEEADRQAQADDEEIFRRLMIMQRRKAEHAHMVSYEVETGGSDPMLPEFWEEESCGMTSHQNTRIDIWEEDEEEDEMMVTPRKKTHTFKDAVPPLPFGQDIEDEWAREAAEAEQAERDAEEAEVARRVEEAYGLSIPASTTEELEMDWNAFDAMDIE